MKKNNLNFFIAACILPTLILYLLFTLYPVISAFKMGFYSWSGLAEVPKFIGIENFITLIGDELVWKSLFNNLFLILVVPILTMALALFFAYVLTKRKLREKNFYRTVFFFPNVLSLVIISVLWMFIYNPTFGILNGLMDSIGLGHYIHVWLGESETVKWSLAATIIWSYVLMILFLC